MINYHWSLILCFLICKADGQQDGASSSSSSSSSSGSSSSSSNSASRRSSSPASSLSAGGAGLRGIWGRHGERHREAIAEFLPYLKRVLGEPGNLAKPERENVKQAVTRALADGVEQCWGTHKVYKSRRNLENAITNLYYAAAVANLHET